MKKALALNHRYSYTDAMVLSRAAVLLTAWREERELTQTAASELFEISQPMLSEYESGKKIPRTLLALKIAQLTKGKVPVASWGEPAAEPAAPDSDRGEHFVADPPKNGTDHG